MYKIGFACKYKHPNQTLPKKEIEEIERSYNSKTTTLRWMSNQTKNIQYEKLHMIVSHNMKSLNKLLNYVITLPKNLQMLRISSDLLPFYDHKDFKHFYGEKELLDIIISGLKEFGDKSRKHNVKVSMHPAQYCVLASDKPHVIENSIGDFEYHADLIRMMGYGKEFQDFKCNVHISGALGAQGIIDVIPKLSKEAQNSITIENDEKKYGLDSCLELIDHCPIVLDIHHHWCREGERISVNDPRIDLILKSWRGKRPTMHYSQSREYFEDLGQSRDEHFDMNKILTFEGVNKKDTYAHSDMIWNNPCNDYAAEFLDKFDIMIEAKHKNLASIDFYKKAKKIIDSK
tara:strand:+ start:10628 stop:11662 length:1035 start_codon:yes stop_codon:yes gene_type:complete